MYDIIAMQRELKESVRLVEEHIAGRFKVAFEQIYPKNEVPRKFEFGSVPITLTELKSVGDLEGVFSGEGFYIILTTYPMVGNECKLRYGRFAAIYRGECRKVRERVRSHLFHSDYESTYSQKKLAYEAGRTGAAKRFHLTYWPQCLKLEAGGLSGIDVDSPCYSDHRWIVIVHKMRGSSQPLRVLAERAFDNTFCKPVASREKKRV